MASLDTNRPAAMEQLAILGSQIGVDTLPIVPGEDPVTIARRAKTQAALGGYDVYMLDTAGRPPHRRGADPAGRRGARRGEPRETLLVVDGLTGQVAVEVAKEFDDKIGVRRGADRGWTATAAAARRCPCARSPASPSASWAWARSSTRSRPSTLRIAGRILGMGDIVALVERAQETFEAEQAERMMRRFQKGIFNMNDLRMQLEQMLRMGGVESMMSMMPGMAKMRDKAAEAGLDDRMIRRQIALINSMTKKERANPDLLQASRKKRIAAGAGLEVSELNKLLKQQRQMADVMKKLGGTGKGGLLKQAVRQMFGKGGPNEADMAAAQAAMAQGKMPQLPQGMQLPKGFGGQNPFGGGGLPQGLSGLMRKK
jgi:signal recognition particle subunit SRP54